MGEGGRGGSRRTSRRIYLWDRVSTGVITFGGVGVLAAVLGLCVYLVWVVMPLFRSAEVREVATADLSGALSGAALVAVDGSDRAVLVIERAKPGTSGPAEAVARGLADGQEFARVALGPGGGVTAAARSGREGIVGLAFADGTIRLGRVEFAGRLLGSGEVPEEARRLAIGEAVRATGSMIERATVDGWRAIEPRVELGEPIALRSGRGAIVRLDVQVSPAGQRYIVAGREDGSITFGRVRTVRALGARTGRDQVTEIVVRPGEERVPPIGDHFLPELFVTADGSSVLEFERSGRLRRWVVAGDGSAVAGGGAGAPAEEISAVGSVLGSGGDDGDGRVRATAATMLLGGMTLVVGTDDGMLRAWSVGQDPTSPAADGGRLVELSAVQLGAGVRTLTPSPRQRTVVAGLEDGRVVVRHMTSRKEVARMQIRPGFGYLSTLSASGVAMGPGGDVVVAWGAESDGATMKRWRVEGGHAEASFSALFRPLIYEGRTKPEYVYQSGAGSEGAESKMSLVPLVYGTLKATLVAMLFAVPLGVLAAIYSSEFMSPGVRKVVKPGVEMMASLPSVVLGFIAAMVLAPWVAERLSSVVAVLIVTPMAVVVWAHVWQLLPMGWSSRVTRRVRLGLVGVVLVGSAWGASVAGPMLERRLFVPTAADVAMAAGSFEAVDREAWPAWVGRRASMSADEERVLREEGLYFRDGAVVRAIVKPEHGAGVGGDGDLIRWLNGSIGGARPGWFVLLAAPGAIVAWLALSRLMRTLGLAERIGRDRRGRAWYELARCVGSVALGLGLAWGAAGALSGMGIDARDVVLGTFSQRNALVVGIIMGFAVIPIIYTISEDALRSVPNSLRSASLGVGATPWQTAVLVVLPSAASGVFSACMIGLGRAVGETMIVLMATGNMPDMSGNIFSGFRTLAANIAVELPYSEQGGTHYRVLFLCGLLLFAMTFVVNTTAEVVRQRFRKRNAAL